MCKIHTGWGMAALVLAAVHLLYLEPSGAVVILSQQ